MQKEVINLCDGTRLGCPDDFEFDGKDGKITGIVISRPCGFLGLGRTQDLVIPWHKIECIGEDAILVRLNACEMPWLNSEASKRKKRL